MLIPKAMTSGVTNRTNRRKDEKIDTHKRRQLSSHLKHTYVTQIAPFKVDINISLYVDLVHHRTLLITSFPFTNSLSYCLYE